MSIPKHGQWKSSPWTGALVIAFLAAISTTAAALEPPAPDGSVATSDGLAAPLVQPAGLPAGRAAGLGLTYDVPLAGLDTTNPFGGLAVFVNTDGPAYAYERAGTADVSTLAVGFGGNLSFGGSYRWRHGAFDNGAYLLGALARPHDAVSLGITYTDTIGGGERELRAGVGLRPLAFLPGVGHRLTLSADTTVSFAPQAAWTMPFLRLEARPTEGFSIRGGYDLDSGAWQVGASVSLGSIVSGASGWLGESAEVTGVRLQTHLPSRRFPSVTRVRERRFVDYSPGPQIVEYAPEVPGGLLQAPGGTPILTVLRQIQELSKDPTVGGIVFRNHTLNASYANILEIRDALARFKETGKSVYFYFDSVSTLNYALAASVGDGVFLNPAGQILLGGFTAGNLYASELLESLGIQVVNFRSHPYKTAFNALSESDMTQAEREALEGVLADYHEQLVRLIESGRGDRLAAGGEQTVAEGPYLTAEAASEAGLVDGLVYEDQLEDAIREVHPTAVFTPFTAEERAPLDWSRPRRSSVAVVYATGSIVTGSGAGGSILGSATMARLLQRAREDAAVRAVVIRIDSGGGSGLASEIIAREVALTREAGKPVIVSMAGTAASGGYFIAAAADRILAQPVTLTGSIGVTALSVHFPELLSKLRLAFAQVSTADSADFLSSFQAPEEQDIQQLDQSIRWQYDRFVRAVAEGREMSEEAVRDVAQGRIWSGRQALERGLVDELGGFADALQVAKDAAGIVGPIRIVPFTEMIDPQELLRAAQGGGTRQATDVLRTAAEEALHAVNVHHRMAQDGLLYYEPLQVLPTP